MMNERNGKASALDCRQRQSRNNGPDSTYAWSPWHPPGPVEKAVACRLASHIANVPNSKEVSILLVFLATTSLCVILEIVAIVGRWLKPPALRTLANA